MESPDQPLHQSNQLPNGNQTVKRLFVAIPLSKSCSYNLGIYQQYLLNQIQELNNSSLKLRMTPVNNLHITLKFLGKIPGSAIPIITDHLRQIAKSGNKFTLDYDRVGFAPPKKRPSMIWVYFQSNPTYINLVNTIHQLLHAYTPEKDTKNANHPHITLTRFKSFINQSDVILPKFEINALTVKEIILFESQLSQAGAEYHVVERFALN